MSSDWCGYFSGMTQACAHVKKKKLHVSGGESAPPMGNYLYLVVALENLFKLSEAVSHHQHN